MTKIVLAAALAGSTALAVPARARGIFGVHNEADATAALAELQRTWASFRETNDRRLADLERGRDDVVTNEHVDRINASITELTNTVNTQQETIQALRLGGSAGGDQATPEAREHRAAFNTWFRRGEGEQNLGGLQVNAALTSQSDPDGGYVVPAEMDRTISRVLGMVSVMRQLARVVSIGTREWSTLVNKGGANANWVGEEDARAATNTPQLAEITIQAMEMYANPGVTQRLLDDAWLNIEQWLADEISQTFAETEGLAFISGDGNKKPRGILSYPTVANASYAWGKLGFTVSGAATAFASTSPTDALMDLYYSLKAGYRNGASFLTSDAVLGTIRKFKDGQNNYIWSPPTADMPGTILGKPVYTDDNMPALGANAFPVAFGNFQRGYLIADRMGTRVLRDPYTNKPYVQFYTTKRVGGGVVNYEAIKLLKCST